MAIAEEILVSVSMRSTSRLAFHQVLGTLTLEASRLMERQPDLPALIGAGNLERMRLHHHDHAALMDNVFFFGSFDLLTQSLPRIYHEYTISGFSLDYFQAAFGAWKHTVQLQVQPDLAKPILGLYDWMIKHHQTFAAQARLLAKGMPTKPVVLDLECLVDALLAGDREAASRMVTEAVGVKPSLEHLYLHLIEPVLHEVGRRWELARITPAQEHVASALVTRIMGEAYANLDLVPTPGKRAVVCTGPREQHQIGAWMVSDLLEVIGWDAQLLGAVPSPVNLLDQLTAFRPSVLALSITLPTHLQDASMLIQAVRSCPGLEGLRIMVGGQALRADPEWANRQGVDGYAKDAREAALLADTWWEGTMP